MSLGSSGDLLYTLRVPAALAHSGGHTILVQLRSNQLLCQGTARESAGRTCADPISTGVALFERAFRCLCRKVGSEVLHTAKLTKASISELILTGYSLMRGYKRPWRSLKWRLGPGLERGQPARQPLRLSIVHGPVAESIHIVVL